jgi:phosphatidylserine decarboxylase
MANDDLDNCGDADEPAGRLRHLVHLARDHVPPMHPAGRPFVLGLAGAALVGRRVWRPLGGAAALAAAATALFFREPKRVPPVLPGAVAAAADGTVCVLDEAVPPAEIGAQLATADRPVPRVSVFLSIFDVHVQRAPVTGTVRAVAYRPGRFLSADLDKASENNERNTVLLTTAGGHDVAVVQIAGLVARRIVCDARPDQPLEIGQTYGLIRFGSRVDVYLPPGSTVLVRPGQRTIGGETVLGELPAPAKTRG